MNGTTDYQKDEVWTVYGLHPDQWDTIPPKKRSGDSERIHPKYDGYSIYIYGLGIAEPAGLGNVIRRKKVE